MLNKLFSKSSKRVPSEEEASEPNSFTNLTAEKLKSVILSLNQADNIFQKAGYLMERLDVEFGQQPRLIPQFKQINLITDSEQDSLLSELEDQQLIKFILISLFKSARMQSLFDNSNMDFYGMEIDITSSPSVRTIFLHCSF